MNTGPSATATNADETQTRALVLDVVAELAKEVAHVFEAGPDSPHHQVWSYLYSAAQAKAKRARMNRQAPESAPAEPEVTDPTILLQNLVNAINANCQVDSHNGPAAMQAAVDRYATAFDAASDYLEWRDSELRAKREP